jgi:hypothetical protein
MLGNYWMNLKGVALFLSRGAIAGLLSDGGLGFTRGAAHRR